jgi:hypothetical protein
MPLSSTGTLTGEAERRSPEAYRPREFPRPVNVQAKASGLDGAGDVGPAALICYVLFIALRVASNDGLIVAT